MKIKTFILLMLIGFNSALFAKIDIERVEPAFWWAGMSNSELQVLIYGDNIAELKAEVDHPGVNLDRCVLVESPNYQFLYFNISKEAKPGFFDIRFTRKGKTVLQYKYELKERSEGSARRIGYDASDVMYLITPDRFVNGKPGNDNMPGMKESSNRMDKDGRHGGDLEGIIKNLDYLEDMGFTALWLNPVMENNMTRTSYHGYAITDFYNTDARYGTNADYLKLVSEAKARGIKVVIDMILNHCGSEHWWMNDLPTSDWINFQDAWKPTTHLRETNLDPYASDYDKMMHSDGWFVETMPDLNQRNPLLADYLIYNTIWWIEYADLSGIRMDTYPYPDKQFMADWTMHVMSEYPNFNIVGEEWSVNPSIVAYWQKGKQNHDAYTSELPGIFDFPLQEALVKALNEDDSQWGQGLIRLYSALANDFIYANPMQLVTFLDNHDMSRFYTQVNEDFDLFKMGMAYISVVRGVPQIYYGTEILMTNPNSDAHGEIRSDFPGGWKGDQVNAFTGEGLNREQLEAQLFVKNLLNWRKDCQTVHLGNTKHFAPAQMSGIYTLFRYDNEKAVMLIMNKNSEQVEVPLDKYRKEVIGEVTTGKDVIKKEAVDLSPGKVTVEARSFVLLEIEL